MRRRIPGWRFAAAALLPMLGGCVAAAAIPVLAGGALVTKKVADNPPRPQQPRESVATTRGDVAPARSAAVPAAGEPTGVRLANLTALPPPSGFGAPATAGASAGAATWDGFAAYALSRAGRTGSGKIQSALLESPPSLESPRFRACKARSPAVIIDLDPGKAPFASEGRTAASADLRSGLERLRQAGVVVMWISQAPADSIGEISAALQRSGLNPAGHDPVLLVRSAGERKQTLREQAGEDACVIAIAGDRLGDFDEFFDYLRDPSSAAAYNAQLGAGWFLVPPPLG